MPIEQRYPILSHHHPYCPSLLPGPLDSISCPHTTTSICRNLWVIIDLRLIVWYFNLKFSLYNIWPVAFKVHPLRALTRKEITLKHKDLSLNKYFIFYPHQTDLLTYLYVYECVYLPTYIYIYACIQAHLLATIRACLRISASAEGKRK